MVCFFFFNDTATTEIYTLSLHDALPICQGGKESQSRKESQGKKESQSREKGRGKKKSEIVRKVKKERR